MPCLKRRSMLTASVRMKVAGIGEIIRLIKEQVEKASEFNEGNEEEESKTGGKNGQFE